MVDKRTGEGEDIAALILLRLRNPDSSGPQAATTTIAFEHKTGIARLFTDQSWKPLLSLLVSKVFVSDDMVAVLLRLQTQAVRHAYVLVTSGSADYLTTEQEVVRLCARRGTAPFLVDAGGACYVPSWRMRFPRTDHLQAKIDNGQWNVATFGKDSRFPMRVRDLFPGKSARL